MLRRLPRLAMLALMAAMAASLPAAAHLLKIYAEVADGVVAGEAYFSTGTVPSGVTVQVYGPGQHKLGETVTDDHGKFHFTPTVRQNLTFLIDAGDNHRAEWTVEADELPATLPAR